MSRLDSFKDNLKAAVTKIEASLRRYRWKEALIFSSFTLLALGFWLLVSLQQEYETEISIPVVYHNIPPDISFSEEMPKKITVRIKDKGNVLLNYSIRGRFMPLEVDMKNSSSKTGTLSVSREEIEASVSKQILSTTIVNGYYPQKIELKYSPISEKEVPVIFDGEIKTQPGYRLSGDIKISPSRISVYANKEVLDSVFEVKTSFIKIEKGEKTVSRNIKLAPIKGVNFSSDAVSVIIPIEEFTEKTIKVHVECEDVPSQYIIRTFPAEIEVTCNIPISRFKELDAEDLAINLSFKDMEEIINGAISIDLTKKPEWIKDYMLNPNKIEFILEKKSY